MLAFAACRLIFVSCRSVRIGVPLRQFALTPQYHNFGNMKQMMDELSKNPKAMSFIQAIKKDPKILQVAQDLIMTMEKKGFIDLKHPTKQPSFAMLADSEIRHKIFELMKLLTAAGLFNSKDGANPTDAVSNIMGLLMPSSSEQNRDNKIGEEKRVPPLKADYTFDATDKSQDASTKETTQPWGEKLKICSSNF